MEIQPYLFLDGRCEEAIEFYRSAIVAKTSASSASRTTPSPTRA